MVNYAKRKRWVFRLERIPLVVRVMVVHFVLFLALIIRVPLDPMFLVGAWIVSFIIMHWTAIQLDRPHKNETREDWVSHTDRATTPRR